MRFSAAFRPPPALPETRGEEPARDGAPPAALPGADLPEDLDARVRLVGEWQLGETWG